MSQSKTISLFNPAVDFVFKTIFGNPKSKTPLISLINAVLKTQGSEPVDDVVITNSEMPKQTKEAKSIRMDVKAYAKDQFVFNLEVQVGQEADYIQRSLFYLEKIHVEQLHQGKDYETLRPAIGIHLVSFDLFPNRTEPHNIGMFTLLNNAEPLTDQLVLHFIEYNKFRFEVECDTLEWWMEFFKFWEDPDVMANIALRDPGIQEAYNVLQRISSDPAKRQEYESRQEFIMRVTDNINSKYKLGKEEGKIEGKTEGKIEEKIETIRNGLRLDLTLEQIAQLVSLPVEIVQEHVVALSLNLER
jgi:predicted transposase/invertase (TIGR01784 family)